MVLEYRGEQVRCSVADLREVATAVVGWKLDTMVIFPENLLRSKLFTLLARRYKELYQEDGSQILEGH